MTDEQIIKYWNEIDSEIINEHGEEFDVYITMPVAKSTVDLINRQKAEAERLENIKFPYRIQVETSKKIENEIKSEAIKEFAERLKGYPIVENESKEIAYLFVEVRDIDNLVKEMTEGKE